MPLKNLVNLHVEIFVFFDNDRFVRTIFKMFVVDVLLAPFFLSKNKLCFAKVFFAKMCELRNLPFDICWLSSKGIQKDKRLAGAVFSLFLVSELRHGVL